MNTQNYSRTIINIKLITRITSNYSSESLLYSSIFKSLLDHIKTLPLNLKSDTKSLFRLYPYFVYDTTAFGNNLTPDNSTNLTILS